MVERLTPGKADQLVKESVENLLLELEEHGFGVGQRNLDGKLITPELIAELGGAVEKELREWFTEGDIIEKKDSKQVSASSMPHTVV